MMKNARISAAVRQHWANPDTRAAHGDLTRRRMARPGVSEKIAARTKAAMANPETRTRHREAVAAAMASPAVRQRISECTREAMASSAVRERIRDGMARAKVRAELAPFLAVWAVLSVEARAEALREIVAVMRSP